VTIRLIALLAVVFVAACSEPATPTADSAAPTVAPVAEAVAQQAPADAPAPVVASETIELAQADTETAGADLTAAGYREGEHYARISPAQPTSSTGAGQVEVAEFFMYSCIHCYNFEPYVEQWLQAKADYVNFVRVPTVWNAVVRLHAQAFYAAAALGKGDEMHTPFFREMHVNGNYLQTKDAIADFFARFDVGSEEFENAFESFSVNTSLRRSDELARRYRVDSTPTIVINGKYRTNASMAGGYPQLLELIDALAAAEYAEM
jgi:thiol:disulfide interchange protein DsbA